DSLVNKQERDEESPHAAVSVHKGVDRFELRMRETDVDQRRHLRRRLVQETLQLVQSGVHLVDRRYRRRDECRLFDPSDAGGGHEVLVGSKLTRPLVSATPPAKEYAVYL